MNYGYANRGDRPLIHKTKTSVPWFGGAVDFEPECNKHRRPSHQKKIRGFVVDMTELMVRKNKKGLKATICKHKGCFDSIFDSW